MTSLVVHSSSRIRSGDPTLSLQNALTEFEHILSDSQKIQYRASSSKPDISAVISFIGSIDQVRQGKAKPGVSSRLYTFFQALQQFTTIVDTFVSSDPIYAALIWGGVKTTMLVASNVSSYFDKVTNLIMTIGKFCPAYQSFGDLYPGCLELQNALCDYYAVIIRLCAKIVLVSQRSPTSQTVLSIITPFESEFADYTSQLRQAVDLIQVRCRLAADKAMIEQGQLATAERKKNDVYRHLGGIFRSDVSKQQAEMREWQIRQSYRHLSRLRAKVRQNLSAIDSLKAFKRVLQQRVPRTAEWFQRDAAFIAWRSHQSSCVLWCPGRMGTGKSVLMSSIVEYLHSSHGPTEIISHHFCLPDHPESLQACQIIGSIARQVLDIWIQNANESELLPLSGSTSSMDIVSLGELVFAHLPRDHSYVIVLDGLEECDGQEIVLLLKSLAKLCQKHPESVKIIISSRPEYEKQLRRSLRIDYKLSFVTSAIEADIEAYVQVKLEQCFDDCRLHTTNPTTISRITDALEKGAHGMFLWVQLFIFDICEQHNDHEILALLDSPPPSISQLIDRKIDRIKSSSSAKHIIKLLQYCGVVKRPLTIDEYREFLSLDVEQQFLDSSLLIHDINKIVQGTGGLMYTDEEEETLHYAHHCIRSHLFGNLSQKYSDFDEVKLDLQMGLLSMTYLNFNDFKKALIKMDPASNMFIRPVDIGIESLGPSRTTAVRLTRKLLQNQQHLRKVSGKDLSRQAQNIMGNTNRSSDKLEIQYRFLVYARTHWLDHLEHMTLDEESRMWNRFRGLAAGENQLVDTPWNPAHLSLDKPGGLPFASAQYVRWALQHNKSALLNLVLVYGDVNDRDLIVKTAAVKSLHALMRILQQLKGNNSSILRSGASRAASAGNIACVELYIQCCLTKSPSEIRNIDNPLVLQAAAEAGHLEIVKKLLDAGADVNAGGFPNHTGTALQAASAIGHVEIVKKLLAAGADPDIAIVARGGLTALQAAAFYGHLEVVKMLVAAGSRIDARDTNDETALHKAAQKGYSSIVDELIAAGAKIDSRAQNGSTALLIAFEYYHFYLVPRLLTAGADVNVRNQAGHHPLTMAADVGHAATVAMLLDAGADVNALDRNGRTALQAAVNGDNLEVVQMLLKAGANEIDSGSLRGQIAMDTAQSRGRSDIVEVIRAYRNRPLTRQFRD